MISQGNSNAAVLYLQYNNSVYERTFVFRFSTCSSIINGLLTSKEMLLDSHSSSAGRGHAKYTSCKVIKVLTVNQIFWPLLKFFQFD